MPLPKATDQTGSDVYTLPYKRIVLATKAAGGAFDLEKAKDPATYLKFQVAAWEDPSYATTMNDWMDLSGGFSNYCDEVVDVVPNTGKAAVSASDDQTCIQVRTRVKCCEGSAADGKELTLATCQGFTAQGTCEAAKCVWQTFGSPAVSRCEPAFCIADTNNDSKISTPDYSAVKWEFGRPCTTCQ